jgi:hypothetical protein
MITLQEIAPYLPCKLYVYDENQQNKTDQVVGFFLGSLDFENWSPINSDIGNYKPIMRPLSDLTNEIEVNGEKFVPIVELAKIAFPLYKWILNEECNFAMTKEDVYFDFNYHYYLFDFDGDYLLDQLKLFQKLYEWHFWLGDQERFGKDIININSLKQGI